MSDTERLSRKLTENGYTKQQEAWLKAYPFVLDVYRAAEIANISVSNIMAYINRDTVFGRKARELIQKVTDGIDKDPRFNKAGSIALLSRMIDDITHDAEIESKDKYKLILDIQKEINKMVDGNIAAQKKNVTNTAIMIEGVVDFTKKKRLPEQITEDAEYEEIIGE
jgi:hypothetical protein